MEYEPKPSESSPAREEGRDPDPVPADSSSEAPPPAEVEDVPSPESETTPEPSPASKSSRPPEPSEPSESKPPGLRVRRRTGPIPGRGAEGDAGPSKVAAGGDSHGDSRVAASAGIPWFRILKWGLPVVVAVVLGVIGGITFASAIRLPEVRSLTDFTPSLITQIRDRVGKPFANFSLERRILLKEDEVPELLEQALLASEDQGFYEHGGVDPLAIFRAQWANWRAGEITEGASTLTMQLAREVFLTREQVWSRKVAEAFYAVELEKNLSKQQILTLYLNLVNVGNGNYGMAAAARDYFNKEVAELTLPEAATLVGILPAPSRYNPYRRPDLVLQRRNTVLRRMRDAGYITPQEHDQAKEEPLLLGSDQPLDRLGPYFAEDVRKYLDTTYGTDAVVHGGLQVYTTLDPRIQRAAEKALRDGLVSIEHRKAWRGPIAHVEDGDLPAHTLPSWYGEPVLPDRWYQGLVLSVDRRRAEVKIEEELFELTPEGMRWLRQTRPDQVLEAGDVAWFRLEAPEGTVSPYDLEDEEEEGDEEAGGDEEGGAEEGGAEAARATAEEPRAGEPESALPTWSPEDLELFLEQEPEVEGAVVVLESATGAVRAMVGGWSFQRSKFNRATQAQRQVGSAFKPFVVGAALEMGYTPADTLFDAPTRFPGADQELSYRPRNYYREHFGILTLRRLLELSINVSAVKLQDMIGVERVIDFARRAGVESDLPPYPSLALGTAELTPMELAAAYATIANQGTWVEPYLIEKVVSADGRTMEEHLPNTQSAIDPRVAYVLTHILEGVVDRGTGARLAQLPLALAGKTGTTDDYSDAWFAGFTPRYTLLTWVGHNTKKSIGRNMTGAEAALPIWKQLVEQGLDEGWLREGEEFPVPAGVALQPVEYLTGLLPGPGAERVIEEAFLEGTEPVQEYTPKHGRIADLGWFQQGPFYIPKEGERMPDGWRTASGEIVEIEEPEVEGVDEGAG